MKLTNKCMLITYADSLGENLKDLDRKLWTVLVFMEWYRQYM